jgi:hypothetical protein
MDPEEARPIAHHLTQLVGLSATAGLTQPEQGSALDHLRWAFMRAADPLPTPEPESLFLPDGDAEAYWLAGDRFFKVTGSVLENPEDETRPFASIDAKSYPLDSREWTVAYESGYGQIGRAQAGFQTKWIFRYAGETVLGIDGRHILLPEIDEQLDRNEAFARRLAGSIGWIPRDG